MPGSVYGYSDSIAHSAWTPKIGLEMTLPNGALDVRVGDARVQKRRLQPLVNSRRPRVRS